MFIYLKNEQEILTQELEYQNWRLIFKHSDSCPISRGALSEVELFNHKFSNVPILYLEVKSQRALSNRIESTYKVLHESPQVLLFKWNKLKQSHSHWSITNKWLSHVVNWGYNDKS